MAILHSEDGIPINQSNLLPVAVNTSLTTVAHTAVTVLDSSTSVLAANADRKYALFVNDSDTVLYLKFGTASALNTGIRLNANGGSFEMSAGIGNLYKGTAAAISSVATKKLLVTEGT